MSTYLELARKARVLCGMQGTGPSSVSTVQGPEQALTYFVSDAYVDIQNLREDWTWLEKTQTFSTEANKSTYDSMDVFFSDTLPVKKYQKDSFIIDANSTKKYLQFIERGTFERQNLNSTQTGVPTTFTIDPSSFELTFASIPNGTYDISFRYQKNPQILVNDSDIPLMPLAFHLLIAYKAVEKMSIYLGSPEIYSEYAHEATVMMGQLMRIANPKKRMQARPFV